MNNLFHGITLGFFWGVAVFLTLLGWAGYKEFREAWSVGATNQAQRNLLGLVLVAWAIAGAIIGALVVP